MARLFNMFDPLRVGFLEAFGCTRFDFAFKHRGLDKMNSGFDQQNRSGLVGACSQHNPSLLTGESVAIGCISGLNITFNYQFGFGFMYLHNRFAHSCWWNERNSHKWHYTVYFHFFFLPLCRSYFFVVLELIELRKAKRRLVGDKFVKKLINRKIHDQFLGWFPANRSVPICLDHIWVVFNNLS